MNRRSVIQSIGILLGGAFSAPTLFAMDQFEQKTGSFENLNHLPIPENYKLIVAEVAEMIIPKTSTPGAKDTGVPAFIVMMIADCYKKPEQESFKTGLETLDKQQFLTASATQRKQMLKQLELDTVELMKVYQVQQTKMGDNEDREQMKEQAVGLPFWRLIKELTLFGYYTSEDGLKSSFDYTPIPGKLEMIKLKPGQKLYAY